MNLSGRGTSSCIEAGTYDCGPGGVRADPSGTSGRSAATLTEDDDGVEIK